MADRLEFQELQMKPGTKTKAWAVLSGGVGIGWVQWYTHWRRYTLYPNANTVWDAGCLREVAKFCEDRTKVQQHAAKARREARAN